MTTAPGPERPGSGKVGRVGSHPGASGSWTGQLGCAAAKSPHASQAGGLHRLPGCGGSEKMKTDLASDEGHWKFSLGKKK